MSRMSALSLSPWWQAVLLQVLVLLLASMVLDQGQVISAVLYSSLAFWLGAALLVVRRPRELTTGDQNYVRWAILPIVIFGSMLFLYVWDRKRLL